MGSYFSVEIHIAEKEWDTMLAPNKRFRIEVCEIMQPETSTFYELRERLYVVSQDRLCFLNQGTKSSAYDLIG